jgi:hypothetical protein
MQRVDGRAAVLVGVTQASATVEPGGYRIVGVRSGIVEGNIWEILLVEGGFKVGGDGDWRTTLNRRFAQGSFD